MNGGAEYRQRWTNGEPGRLDRRWIWVLLIGAYVLATPEFAANAQTSHAEAQLQFDIPAQPLAAALKTYSAVTRLEIYYESNLIDGHRSPSIRGMLAPDVALQRLLAGTGFSIRSFEPGTITILLPRQAVRDPGLAAIKSRAAGFTPYFALIQAGLRAALCRVPTIQTDTEELIIRLWIAPSGSITRAEIQSPRGGSDGRHEAYAAAMRSLVIGEPPPRDMPQPVTLMVLPRASRTAAECPQLGSSGRVRRSAHG